MNLNPYVDKNNPKEIEEAEEMFRNLEKEKQNFLKGRKNAENFGNIH